MEAQKICNEDKENTDYSDKINRLNDERKNFEEWLRNEICLEQIALIKELEADKIYQRSEISKALVFMDEIPAGKKTFWTRYSDAFGDIHTFQADEDQLKYLGRNLITASSPFKSLENFEDKRMISSLLKFY